MAAPYRKGQVLHSVFAAALYHVSMADIKLQAGQQSELASDSTMIAPGAEKQFSVKQLKGHDTLQLSFSSINDYGAQDKYSAQLSTRTAAKATETRIRQ
ncbi:fimbrial biogenesis chaperone [Pseudomonas hygromyciniae]